MLRRQTPILLSFILPLLAVLLLASILRAPSAQAAVSATHTVMNTDDSGAGSLREAIDVASSDDIIDFDAALAGQTITLTSQLVITKNLSISGTVPITISGNNSTRVFYIDGANVTLDSLTVYHGLESEPPGGGLYIDSAVVTLTNSFVTSNTAPAGGGIHSINSMLFIDNSTINENQATLSETGGGGIHSLDNSLLVLSDSFVQDNYTDFYGGGILSIISGTVFLTNTVVSGNTAGEAGGGLYIYETAATLLNSSIFSNTAYYGGGIENEFSTLFIDGSHIVLVQRQMDTGLKK